MVLKRQTTINNRTSQLTVKVKELNTRINNLKVSTNNNTYFVSANTASSNVESNTSTSNQVLGSDVTLAGNTFNGPNQLVQLGSSGELPSVDGSNLIAVNATALQGNDANYYTDASNLISGTVSDSLLSSDVALLDADNIFTASNTFDSTVVLNALGSAGNTALCLNGSAQVASCSSGGGSGVSSLDDLIGALTLNDSNPSGSAITIDSASTTQEGLTEYGSTANTAAQGNTSLSFNGTGNLTGNVSGTSGGGFTVDTLNVTDNPNFTGTLTAAGTITFSDLGTGVVHSSNTGVLTSSPIVNNDLQQNGDFANIIGVGVLTSGSIASGFGNIDIGSNTFTGNGSDLTNLNASNISSGTLSDNQLNTDVTTQGNTFNGDSQLVQLTAGGLLPTLNGSNLTNLNGANISSNSIANTALANSSITFDNGSNITGGNTAIPLGGTLTLAVSSSPTFTGNVIVQGSNGLTVGSIANSGTIDFLDGTNDGFSASLGLSGALGSTLAFSLPSTGGTLCTTSTCSSSSGINTVGPIDSQTKSDNGAVISGSTIYLQTADATDVGLVSTGTQSFAGDKTFTGAVTVQGTGGLNVTGAASISGGLNNNGGGITNTGAISSATGISSSGAITFSGIGGAGVVQASSGGALSSSSLNLGTGPVTGQLGVGNGGTGDATLALDGVLYGNGTGTILATAVGSTGQCLVGNTSAAPTWSSCSGLTTLQQAYANGNSISTTGNDIAFTLNSSQNFTVTNAAGSTGFTTFSLANGANTSPPTQLVLVKNNDTTHLLANGIYVQAATGGITTAFNASGSNITNALSIGANAISGTNFNVSGAGAVVAVGINSGTGPIQGTGGLNVTGAASISGGLNNNGGGITNTGAISSATGISSSGAITFSGIGGAGVVQASSGGALSSSSLNLGTGPVTGQLGVGNGGTGDATLALDGVLYGNGTGTILATAVGSTGQCLVGNTSAAPTWSSCSGLTVGTIDSQTASTNGAVITGSSIYLQSASINNPGLVNTSSQSFAGLKTFTSGVTVNTGSANSIAAFQVQNASSQDALQVDTFDNDLSVGQAYTTLPAPATGGGSITVAFYTTTALGSTCGSSEYGASAVSYNPSAGSLAVFNIGGVTAVTGGVPVPTTTVCYGYNNNAYGGAGSIPTWTSTTSLPTALYDADAVAYNGYVYVIGGATNNDVDQTAVYSAQMSSSGLVGSTWNTLSGSALPVALEQATAVVNNGYVYVMGGSSSSSVQSAVYYAQLGSNGTLGAWHTTTSLTNPNGSAFATTGASSFVNNGYIYVAGGGSSASTCSGTTYTSVYYAPINANGTIGTWSSAYVGLSANSLGSISSYTKYASALTWDGAVYILGGVDATGSCSTSTSTTDVSAVFNANGTISSWSSLNGPGTGYFLSATTVVSYPIIPGAAGDMYVIGGTTNAGNNRNSTVYYGQASTGTLASSGSGGQSVNLSVNGATAIQTAVNTQAALTVQNSNGSNVLTVDTVNTDVATKGSLSVQGGVSISGLTTPTITNLAVNGSTGTINYYYRVSAVNGNGNYTAASAALYTTNGPATLASNDSVSINWAGITGASKYYVYRVQVSSGGSPTSLGYIGTVYSNAVMNNQYTFTDTGIAATYTNGATSATSPYPVYDTSGQLTANGTVSFQNTSNSTSAFQIQNSSSQTVLQVDTTGNNINLGTAGGGLDAWQTNSYSLGCTTTGCSSPPPESLSNIGSVTYDGYVYVIGGGQSAVYYAPLNATGGTGAWATSNYALGCTVTSGCGSPVSLYNPDVVVYNGYIYVIGGNNSSNVSEYTVYYAPLNATGGTGAWATSNYALGCTTSGCGSPVALSYATAVVNNGYVYVIGGSTSYTSTPQSTVYYAQLNATGGTGAWATSNYALGCTVTSGCVSQAPVNYATSVVNNGYVYVIGGDNQNAFADTSGSGVPQTTVYYAPLNATGGTAAWQTGSALQSPGLESASAVVDGGYIYLLGGDAQGGQSGTQEQFTVPNLIQMVP